MSTINRFVRGVFAGVAATAFLGIALPAAAAEITFANSGAITIPSSGAASPYPSVIDVAGVSGPVTKVIATISGFNHTWSNDVGAILQGPSGLTVALFNRVSSFNTAGDLTWIFDDAAATALPSSGALISGTFQPSNNRPAVDFPGAPTGPYGTELSAFNDLDPNGNWSLYVYDFFAGDAGSIRGGWSLTFTTRDSVVVPAPATWGLLVAALGLLGAARRRRVITACIDR